MSKSLKLFWWAKCLTFCCLREASGELWYCFNVLIHWPWPQGRVFPSSAISIAMDGADLQPAAMGITGALVYPGLPAEADDRAIASNFHAKLTYAQVTWILRRKALVNHYKGYLVVHKWCPAFKNLHSRSGSKINIVALLKVTQIYPLSPAEHCGRARQKKNFTKCHAGRLLCQKPGSNPDFHMTLLLAQRCSWCYHSTPCWYARKSSALLNESEMRMQMAQQPSKITYYINKIAYEAWGFPPCSLIPHAPNMQETCSTYAGSCHIIPLLLRAPASVKPLPLPHISLMGSRHSLCLSCPGLNSHLHEGSPVQGNNLWIHQMSLHPSTFCWRSGPFLSISRSLFP